MRSFLAALRGLIFRGSTCAAASNERNSTMNAAFEKLLQHLDARDVTYLTNGDNRTIFADFRGEVGTYRIVAAVEPDRELFQVFGYASLRVPHGARPMVAETITRANFGLQVGKFEMDFDEGELRFQASQILTGDSLEDDVIGRLMATTMAMLDIYLPAVLSVVYGNESPEDAVRHAEAGAWGSVRNRAVGKVIAVQDLDLHTIDVLSGMDSRSDTDSVAPAQI